MINNLNAIGKTVDYYHTLFLAENIGYKSLSKEDQEFLKSKGYKNNEKKHDDLLSIAYKFGKLSATGDSRILDKMKLSDLSEFTKDKMPLTKEDRYVLEHIKAGFYNDVKRANNRVKDQINQEIVKLDKDRRYYIRTKLKGKFTDKDVKPDAETLNYLTKYLGNQTKEWNNHFDLITSYNFHSAFQNGIATAALEKYGNSATVWYKVHKDACPSCKKTYLYANGRPKIFKLITILKNGDNIGKKKDEYVASLAPLHPRCRCTIKYNPKKVIKEKEDIIQKGGVGSGKYLHKKHDFIVDRDLGIVEFKVNGKIRKLSAFGFIKFINDFGLKNYFQSISFNTLNGKKTYILNIKTNKFIVGKIKGKTWTQCQPPDMKDLAIANIKPAVDKPFEKIQFNFDKQHEKMRKEQEQEFENLKREFDDGED